jgi:hypothetical protein
MSIVFQENCARSTIYPQFSALQVVSIKKIPGARGVSAMADVLDVQAEVLNSEKRPGHVSSWLRLRHLMK